jgi:hypothetical protein
MVHTAILIRDGLFALQKATKAANLQKKCKWKYVQNQGILIMEEGSQLANSKAAKVIEGSKQAAAKRA